MYKLSSGRVHACYVFNKMPQARATLHFDGWAYNLGDFHVRVGKVTLRPTEEFKGFMVEVEYAPVSTAEQATPALKVCFYCAFTVMDIGCHP